MVKKINWGLPWIRLDKWFPRLFLHEKHEHRIKWALRILTGIGVLTSLITLPPLAGVTLAFFLTGLDVFLERTLFYYTSLYVTAFPKEYDGNKWSAMTYVSFGPPSPTSEKIVGFVFTETEYAKEFFNLLRAWNDGSSEDVDNNIQLTFITDEDRYYVYLYQSIEKRSIKKQFAKERRRNRLRKHGKEHLGMVMQLIICRGFNTNRGHALGDFVDNHPVGKRFLLGAFLSKTGHAPQPILEIPPISKLHYKAKIPSELTEDDFEYHHWRKLVGR